MRYFLGIIGLIFGCLLIKYRQRVGDEFGEQEWAYRIGGVYNVVIIAGILICLWSLAAMTDSMNFLFAPLLSWIPGVGDKMPAGPAEGGIPLGY